VESVSFQEVSEPQASVVIVKSNDISSLEHANGVGEVVGVGGGQKEASMFHSSQTTLSIQSWAELTRA
jgi:hypothetical protein